MKDTDSSKTKEDSMNALLSIKPEFAAKILDGSKKYEFRRTSFRAPESIEKIFLYSTTPVQKIVGAFTISGVVGAPPAQLWERFGAQSGISNRERFMDYYRDTETGYAFEIDQTYEFEEEFDPRSVDPSFSPPASFYYLNGTLLNRLQRLVEDVSRAASD